jgi:calcineurin-like phosphoesterase family protein
VFCFTADWHIGEKQTPNTHSFLRPKPTEEMVSDLISQCHRLITPEDTLVFVGDVGIELKDLAICSRLPRCRKILILGDKEQSNKNFTLQDFLAENARLEIFSEVVHDTVIAVGDCEYYLSHKPLDCINQNRPAICGHVHGIWRSTKLPNGQPIINVGVDAWNGGIVTEAFIEHQHHAITQGYYDKNCFPAEWSS